MPRDRRDKPCNQFTSIDGQSDWPKCVKCGHEGDAHDILFTDGSGGPVVREPAIGVLTKPRTTDEALYSPRGMIADQTATRDPIFLFQVRDYGTSEADYSAMEDLGWKFVEDHWEDVNGNYVTTQMMNDHDIGTLHWDTKRVFATREEAQAYGESRPYDWGDEGIGWRTYCVCAEGKLAEILVQHWKD